MGYYSTVGIAMRTTDYEEMCKQAGDGATLSLILSGKRNAPQPQNKEYTSLYWSYIKWSGYESTEFIMNFLESIEDEYYDYLRIGEYDTDYDLHHGTNERFLEYQRDVYWT